MNSFFLITLLAFANRYNVQNVPKIEFQIANIYDSEQAVGKATYNSLDKKWIIYLDQNSVEYHKNHPQVIELIIYHELGHVLLRLPDSHDDTFMNVDYLDVVLDDDLYRSLKRNISANVAAYE